MNGWVNNHKAGDLICHRAHYDVTVIYVEKYKTSGLLDAMDEDIPYCSTPIFLWVPVEQDFYIIFKCDLCLLPHQCTCFDNCAATTIYVVLLNGDLASRSWYAYCFDYATVHLFPVVPGHCRSQDLTRHGSHAQPFLAAASSHGTLFTFVDWSHPPELSRLLRATPQMTRGSTGIWTAGRRVTCMCNLQPRVRHPNHSASQWMTSHVS